MHESSTDQLVLLCRRTRGHEREEDETTGGSKSKKSGRHVDLFLPVGCLRRHQTLGNMTMWSLRRHMACDAKMYTRDALSRARAWQVEVEPRCK